MEEFIKTKMAAFKKKVYDRPKPSIFLDKIEFHVKKANSHLGPWASTTLKLSEFPYKFANLKDYPYLPDGTLDRNKMVRLVFNDLQGLELNAEWFDRQVEYVKSLPEVDLKLIYDYTVSPGKVSTISDKNRLHQLIQKAPPLLNPLTVWRGVKTDYVSLLPNRLYKNDQRFISTSIDVGVSISNFMSIGSCCLWKINLLPGTRCLFLSCSKYLMEHEILLDRDTMFYVNQRNINVLNGPRKITMTHMTVLK